MTLAQIQYIAFPMVLILVWRLRVLGERIPFVLLMVASLGAVVSIAMSLSYDGSSRDSFVVARFSDDEFGTVSRVFRESAESSTADRILALRHPGMFNSDKEVRSEFESKDVSGVVWGDARWIQVSFFVPGVSPESVGLVNELTGLELIDYVPAIGLSLQPQEASSHFVGTLFKGLLSRKELDLLEAAGIAATWTSFAHRSYPLWVVGNQYLAQSIKGDQFDQGTLNCAIERYKEAEGMLRPGDNTALLVALINNRAVALSVRYYFNNDLEDWREARLLLRRAKGVLRQPNLMKVELPSGEVLVKNLRTLWKGEKEDNDIG